MDSTIYKPHLRISLQDKRLRFSCYIIGLILVLLALMADSGSGQLASAGAVNALKVKAGEIRLEGTVRAVNADEQQVTFAATSFTLPSGKTSALSTPKDKIAVVSAQTVIQSGDATPKPLSLAALKAGANIIIIGQDQGSGRPIPVRLIIVKLGAGAETDTQSLNSSVPGHSVEGGSIESGKANNNATPPLAPAITTPAITTPAITTPDGQTQAGIMEQTVGNYTLRLIKAEFIAPGETANPIVNRGNTASRNLRKVFLIQYDLKSVGQPPQLPPDKTLSDYVTSVRLSHPTSGVLEPRGGGRGAATWNSVNPRWEEVTAEFDLWDPAAPPGVDGEVEEVVEFPNLPVLKDNETRQVMQEVTTPNGVKVVLERVMFQTQARLARFYVRCERLPHAVDMITVPGSADLLDERGKSWKSALIGGNSTSTLGETQFVTATALPPPDTSTFTLKLKIQESIPSRIDYQWLRSFRFPLPLPPVAATPGGSETNPPLAKVITPQVEVQLEESVQRQAPFEFTGLLWLKDTQKATTRQQMWFVKRVKARDNLGKVYNSFVQPQDRQPIYWKANGTVVRPNERADLLTVLFPNMGNGAAGRNPFESVTRPEKLTLEATVESGIRVGHVIVLDDVPVPEAGQSRKLELTSEDGNGGMLILRQITHFTSAKELKGVGNTNLLPSGLALVIECKPVLGPTASIALSPRSVRDEAGHILMGRGRFTGNRFNGINNSMADYRLQSYPLNLSSPGPINDKEWLVLLPAPATPKMQVQLAMQETLMSGRQETITLSDVTVPPSPHRSGAPGSR